MRTDAPRESAEPDSRTLWQLYEPLHDVTYFCPEPREAAEELGLRGFWMGYVAFRAAPLGRCRPGVVTAAFHGFHASRIHRALPHAWARCTPEAAEQARRTSAAAALRRIWSTAGIDPSTAVRPAAVLWDAAQRAVVGGRVLAAANQALPRADDPVETLWQACSTLREHRGDGHLAALVVNDIGPVEAHLMKAAAGEADEQWLQRARNWPDADWAAGWARLDRRGLTTGRRLTDAGRALHQRIENQTDTAAAGPWAGLPSVEVADLAAALRPLTRAVLAGGEIPAGNPVGLG